jgi:DNA-directed RNA polymerase specialized sigma24 family protein
LPTYDIVSRPQAQVPSSRDPPRPGSTKLDAAAYGVDSEQSMIDLTLVLKKLPTRYRQALVLYEVVGLSVDELTTRVSR